MPTRMGTEDGQLLRGAGVPSGDGDVLEVWQDATQGAGIARLVSVAGVTFDVDEIVAYRSNGVVWGITLRSGDKVQLEAHQWAALEPLLREGK
jgi:hypothetical protein